MRAVMRRSGAGVGVVAVCAGLLGCRSSGESTASSSAWKGSGSAPAPVPAPAPAPAPYHARPVPEGRSIEVRLTYAGKTPAPWTIPAAYAGHCGGATQVPHPSLEVGSHGGVNGAIVWLDDVREGEPLPGPGAHGDVVLDQERCTFTPHVLAMAAGATLRLTNGDPANHVVRLELLGAPDADNPTKVLAPHGEDTLPTSAAWAGSVARVTCPVHPWMLGWIRFFDHPYFAVTKDGVARIEKVPPGTWHLSVWHEALDASRTPEGDTVTEGAPTQARFEVKIERRDVTRALTLQGDGTIR